MKQQQKLEVPLTYPLPTRNWLQNANGLWSSKEWTDAEKKIAEQARRKVVFK